MSFRIDPTAPVPDEVARLGRERLSGAAAALVAIDDDPVDAVHTARKDIKKTRALLRLARPAMSAKAHRKRDRELRDIGRSLSGARDADVLVETVAGLHERFAGRLPATAFDDLAEALAAPDAKVEVDRSALRGLERAASDVDRWPVGDCDRRTLRAGIARAYEDGADRMQRALDKPTTENLHAWRKRVKDLWYHARLLKPFAPVELKALAGGTDRLAEALGDEHDLGVLAEHLRADDDLQHLPAVDVPAIQGLIAERRTELRQDIAVLGARVYAERPKAFRRRIAGYLRVPAAMDAARPPKPRKRTRAAG